MRNGDIDLIPRSLERHLTYNNNNSEALCASLLLVEDEARCYAKWREKKQKLVEAVGTGKTGAGIRLTPPDAENDAMDEDDVHNADFGRSLSISTRARMSGEEYAV